MNIYKTLLWIVVAGIYLFVMWGLFPMAFIEIALKEGVEVSYLSAVFQTHGFIAAFLSFSFGLSWLSIKAGY